MRLWFLEIVATVMAMGLGALWFVLAVLIVLLPLALLLFITYKLAIRSGVHNDSAALVTIGTLVVFVINPLLGLIPIVYFLATGRKR